MHFNLPTQHRSAWVKQSHQIGTYDIRPMQKHAFIQITIACNISSTVDHGPQVPIKTRARTTGVHLDVRLEASVIAECIAEGPSWAHSGELNVPRDVNASPPTDWLLEETSIGAHDPRCIALRTCHSDVHTHWLSTDQRDAESRDVRPRVPRLVCVHTVDMLLSRV